MAGGVGISADRFLPTPSAKFSVQFSNAQDTAVDSRQGPEDLASRWAQLSSEDLERGEQSIFLQYYKLARRTWIPIKKVVAASGPHELPRQEDLPASPAVRATEDRTVWSEKQHCEDAYHVPRVETFDPVGDLLDYLAEHSDADFVCASDMDLTRVYLWDGRMLSLTYVCSPYLCRSSIVPTSWMAP